MSNLQLFAQTGKKIIGVAANYGTIESLEKDVPKEPGIFIKPSTSYITEGKQIMIPKGFSVNEEVELGIIIGKKAKHVSREEAMRYVGGYCVALDMTATCRLKEARSTGGSWTLGKGFDTATPVGKFIPTSDIKNPHDIVLWCSVNSKRRQEGCTSDMVFDIPTLISFISKFITLEENDLILTGSPPGMGPVDKGDIVEAGIEGLTQIQFTVDKER